MKRTIIGQEGVRIDLDGGGFFYVFPQEDNLPYLMKSRQLFEAARKARGLSLEEKLGDVLDVAELLDITVRALIGTVIRFWGDFDRPDGSAIEYQNPDGSINEDGGVEILLFPGVDSEFKEKMAEVNRRYVRDVKVAEGNSSEPSDGTSATAGSS